jgi:hypothetical protein
VRQIFPFSSIRTLTVGFGIAPNLLTPPIARRALAGFGDRSPFTAGGDFHPAPRTRSDRNPTNSINAPLAKPCNDFRELLDHAEPTDLNDPRSVPSWGCLRRGDAANAAPSKMTRPLILGEVIQEAHFVARRVGALFRHE